LAPLFDQSPRALEIGHGLIANAQQPAVERRHHFQGIAYGDDEFSVRP